MIISHEYETNNSLKVIIIDLIKRIYSRHSNKNFQNYKSPKKSKDKTKSEERSNRGADKWNESNYDQTSKCKMVKAGQVDTDES